MKKLLLLFVSVITLTSCSSDDAPAPAVTPSVEVVSHTHEHFEVNTIGHRFEFFATLKNNTTNTVTGKVKFTVPNGNALTYAYIEDVSLTAGETKAVSAVAGGYYQTQTITVTNAEFIAE